MLLNRREERKEKNNHSIHFPQIEEREETLLYDLENFLAAAGGHLVGLSFYRKFTGKSVKLFYRFTGKLESVNFGKRNLKVLE